MNIWCYLGAHDWASDYFCEYYGFMIRGEVDRCRQCDATRKNPYFEFFKLYDEEEERRRKGPRCAGDHIGRWDKQD